ncbi:MAG TPA: FAD-linked oxidase C-terminal domain-containing protein [Thiobacillaceae bacterium]|nr:FAD-linked oxidase C-terminal domain-containing protein [Thiobacillaceae bacterium]HNA83062.1 FAD-linked oxidase C-terminal domain-containing protein [Thiobacillaceae bacterium]HNH90367.1 FAD-linked oxidase C-terminal domain-containing protein [Thiobacillaceae bacterium]HNI09056.1 FAD-linked oxidase C-terminal domain-containing protein [Thiobacillaceae bacterium]
MLSTQAQADLLALLGEARALLDEATRALYASDETPRACVPEAVLFPTRHEDVAALVGLANRHGFPLVARGAGSGNVGGALPAPGSAVVSFECMNRVLEFDPANRLMVVQPGVVTDDIDALAATAGLMYAPDPGSGAYCRIGGNLAMNAAGPRCVKYGATRDHVLGLRAVTGSGRELRVGGRTSKYATAYDLTRLLVGSEGTLALITEATLKLVPAPETVATLRVCYADNAAACAAVVRVMAQPVVPCALEFMDSRSIEAIREYGGAEGLPSGTRAVLMVEADGDRDDVPHQIDLLEKALRGEGLLEIQSGFAAADIKNLWTARKSLSHAVKKIAPLKINEDVVVPVARLANLVNAIDALGHHHRVPIVSFGHAGNGNLHVNLMVHPDDDAEMARARACRDALVEAVLGLGGSLSGEHGIGSEKRRYVGRELDADTLAMMRDLKGLFDPRGILNPGKKLPDGA